MSELIAIREAARRLGVSDTAVHKAIKAGRIKVAGKHPNNGRPLLEWSQTQADWLANSSDAKRSHVGSRGSPRREADPPPRVQLPTSDRMDEGPQAPAEGRGPSYAASRAVREAYQARLAKLDFEERTGRLVSADEIKARAFKMARGARDALLTLPDRLAPILASTTDVVEVHRLLLEDIERTCRQIAEEAAKAA